VINLLLLQVTPDFKPLNMELENPFANPEEEV
jgi:hypothetical protein